MGGGLMQLVAYGAQDIYLTGNPQITFFKVVYRRHTNFSMESIIQTFNGTPSFGGSTLTATISRNGDLVHRMWIAGELNSTSVAVTTARTYCNWTNNTGHAFVKECEIEIGGQRIDRHYSQWLDVYNELTDHEESEWIGLNKHAAKNAYLQSTTGDTPLDNLRLYVPLKFWFCRNPGLALPLIALQYHEVKLKLTTRPVISLVNTDKRLEVSVLFKFINKTCFNALYRENKKGEFNVPFGNGRNPTICDKENIEQLNKYLNENDIQINNSDFGILLDSKID